jgi:hypothetical protein
MLMVKIGIWDWDAGKGAEKEMTTEELVLELLKRITKLEMTQLKLIERVNKLDENK